MFYDVADRERTDYILGERGPSRAAAPVWSLPACLFGCRRRTRLRWFCPRHAGHAHGGPGKGLDLAPYIMKLGVLGLVCMDARAVAGVACVAPGALREAGALSAARAAGKEQGEERSGGEREARARRPRRRARQRRRWRPLVRRAGGVCKGRQVRARQPPATNFPAS